jgi:Domain of unknown function (DUF1841)
MFNPSRDEVRDFFFGLWRKHEAREPLTPLEAQALDWVLEHPEYHMLLSQPEQYRHASYTPESGGMNPFLHLSMHLSIAEQVSIDQPPGIKAQYARLTHKHQDAHQAAHTILECLGEMLFNAQRSGLPPDGAAYLESIRRR